MINKKQFNQFAKRIISSQKGLSNQQLMHPRREWLIGIFVAVSIFFASIAWSSIKYLQYQNIDQQLVSQPEAALVVYRAALVDDALKIFASKAQQLDKILQVNPFDVTQDVESKSLDDSPKENTNTVSTSTATTTATTTIENEIISSSTKETTEPVGDIMTPQMQRAATVNN